MKLPVLLILSLALVSTAYGFGSKGEGCSGDCTACHGVKKEEVTALLRGVDPSATVVSVEPSAVRGLYEVTIRREGSAGIVYLDFSKRFFIAGRIFDTGIKKDVTAEALDRLRRIDPAKLPPDAAVRIGNRAATKRIYVFTDPQCPFCAKYHRELLALTREDPQVEVFIYLTPLDIHPRAAAATDTILCAAAGDPEEGVRLLEMSLDGMAIGEKRCGREYAELGRKLYRELGLRMTPTTVFADGRVVDGVRSAAELRGLLNPTGAGPVAHATKR